METSAPILKTCARCEARILTGLAEGIHAYVDLTPVTTAGEIAALLAGRETYTLRRYGLIRRDVYRRTDPALATPVLADHDCPRRAR
jgi:hypothetical protein